MFVFYHFKLIIIINKESKVLNFTTIKIYNFSITNDILRMNTVAVENIF